MVESSVVCPTCNQRCNPEDIRCSRCGSVLPTRTHKTGAEETLAVSPQGVDVTNTILQYRVASSFEFGDFTLVSLVEKDGKQFLLKRLAVGDAVSNEVGTLISNERAALTRLQHSGLPQGLQLFLKDGFLHHIVDYFEGQTLLENVYPYQSQNDRLDLSQCKIPHLDHAIRWSLHLANTIGYMHGQKPFPIIHRNINPMTVWVVQSTRQTKLVDFGLTNSFYYTARKSPGGSTLKPGGFASPDLFEDGWGDVRTDIYAFGRMLDFLFSGAIPADANTPPLFPSSRSLLDSDTHGRLATLIARCCQLSPDARYTDIEEVKNALQEILLGSVTLASDTVTCICGEKSKASMRLCPRCGRLLHTVLADPGTGNGNLDLVLYEDEAEQQLLRNYQQGRFAPLSKFKLREDLDQVQSTPGFDELVSLDNLPYVEKMPHQKDAALKVLREMRGRALLADEVGLGKTIEAGLILKELVQRSLASRVLIFCPPQLRGQWQSELYEKFSEIFLVLGRDIGTPLAWYSPHLIASYDVVLDRFHREVLVRQNYDLVILDEAHYLNYSENQQVLQVMKSLHKKYFLLLSATPMHNSLEELYNIITLLRPGHFEGLESFKKEFIDENTGRPIDANIPRLSRALHEVMIRNNRDQVKKHYHFPERHAEIWPLELNESARSYYLEFRRFLVESTKDITNPQVLEQVTHLVERLCSSKPAFLEPVNRLRRDPASQKIFGNTFLSRLQEFGINFPDQLIQPKIRQLINVLQEMKSRNERVLVFSQFQETASFLWNTIRTDPELKEQCILYNERTSQAEKDRSLESFFHSTRGILFCPAEASEGLNLQFCSVMINFDLPWDPMKLEQRIGRIQRIGGKHKIFIINLVLKDTIEADIIEILQDKIGIFKAVVGHVEEILGNFREEDDIPAILGNIFLERDMEVEKYIEEDEEYDDQPIQHIEEEIVSAREYLDRKFDSIQERSGAGITGEGGPVTVLDGIYFEFEDE